LTIPISSSEPFADPLQADLQALTLAAAKVVIGDRALRAITITGRYLVFPPTPVALP
jgi:hypothetical protein